jgi:hypothetical protein
MEQDTQNITSLSEDFSTSRDPWERIFKSKRPSTIYRENASVLGPLTEEEKDRVCSWVKKDNMRYYLVTPKEPIAALEMLKLYFAQLYFEYLQLEFFRTYGTLDNIKSFSDELSAIKGFIEAAQATITKKEAFSKDYKNLKESNCLKHEYIFYIRLTEDYYINNEYGRLHLCHQSNGSAQARIYGTYVLFEGWLEENVNRLTVSTNVGSVGKDFKQYFKSGDFFEKWIHNLMNEPKPLVIKRENGSFTWERSKRLLAGFINEMNEQNRLHMPDSRKEINLSALKYFNILNGSDDPTKDMQQSNIDRIKDDEDRLIKRLVS